MNLQISSYIGDSPERIIPLVADVGTDLTPFAPDGNWTLLLTAKRLLTDSDEDAEFQLLSGAGITVSGALATCLLTPDATNGLIPAKLYWDIRATHSTGETHIVASGRWRLTLPATRLALPSMTIFSLEPFTLFGGGAASDLAYDATAWNGDTDAPTKNAVRDKIETLAPLISPSFITPSLGDATATGLFVASGGIFVNYGDITTSAPGTRASLSLGGGGSLELGSTGIKTVLTGTATADRAIALPDAAGTLALTSQIPAAPTAASLLATLAAANASGSIDLGKPFYNTALSKLDITTA